MTSQLDKVWVSYLNDDKLCQYLQNCKNVVLFKKCELFLFGEEKIEHWDKDYKISVLYKKLS